VRKADNLPPPFAVVTKSGSLIFLEPSGPVQTCNGTALPFFFTVCQKKKIKIYRHGRTILAPSFYALNYFENSENRG